MAVVCAKGNKTDRKESEHRREIGIRVGNWGKKIKKSII